MLPDTIGSLKLSQLTRVPSKSKLYFQDAFFRENAVHFSTFFRADSEATVSQLCVLVIRPDALILAKSQLVIHLALRYGFRPLTYRQIQIDRVMLRELWRFSFTQANIDRILVHERLFGLAPAVAIIFWSPSNSPAWPASVDLSLKKGSAQQERRSSSDLRSILKSPSRFLSLIHVTDEPADVIRELGIMFSWQEREQLYKEVRERLEREYSCEENLLFELRRLEGQASHITSCQKRSGPCHQVLNNDNHAESFAIPYNCSVRSHLVAKSSSNSEITLAQLDQKLIEMGCNCPASRWVSVALAGEAINPYDRTALPNPLEKFRPFWLTGST